MRQREVHKRLQRRQREPEPPDETVRTDPNKVSATAEAWLRRTGKETDHR